MAASVAAVTWRYTCSGSGPRGGRQTPPGEYREVNPPDRVVFTEFYKPYPDSGSVVTAVYTEEHGKTRLTLTALYPSIEVRDMVLQTGMEKGAAISYDRLEEVAMELQQA